MPDEPEPLTPATPDEIAQALAFALRFNGRRRVHHADDAMARITAERLVQYLERARFVVMKRPPEPAPRVPGEGQIGSAWLPPEIAGSSLVIPARTGPLEPHADGHHC